MDRPVRVAVANQPRLMRELVLETVRQEPDINVVAEIQNESDIARVVDESNPDFLIVALDDSDRYPVVCELLLHRHPQMKVLALAAERNRSVFYWTSLDIHSSLIETSEAGILGALRGSHIPAGG